MWLDPRYTSPYHFYQFWLNGSDVDTERYIRIFTLFPKEKIDALIEAHRQAPHQRILQRELAEDITIRVHGKEAYDTAVKASGILFGKGTTEALKELPEDVFLAVFDGVPMHDADAAAIQEGVAIIDFLAEKTGIAKSKGEARRMLKEGSISINKAKVKEDQQINNDMLINGKYILVQRGKKNYYLVKVR